MSTSEEKMEEKIIAYDVICHTNNCDLSEKIITVYGPENTEFLCGPCGNRINDWKLSENN